MKLILLFFVFILPVNGNAVETQKNDSLGQLCEKLHKLDELIKYKPLITDDAEISKAIKEVKKYQKYYPFPNSIGGYDEYIEKISHLERANKDILILVRDEVNILSTIFFGYLPQYDVVRKVLDDFNIVRVDVSGFTPRAVELLDKLNVLPPAIIVGTKGKYGEGWSYSEKMFTKCMNPDDFAREIKLGRLR